MYDKEGPIETRITIRSGKVKPILFRHPWVYSGSIRHMPQGLEEGAIVTLYDEKNNFLARGCYNSNSQIAVRIFSWNQSEEIDRDFFRRKLEKAVSLRNGLAGLRGETDCYRLVHSEADELPGLIVDRYGDYLVLQITCLGLTRFLPDILDALEDLTEARGIYERIDQRMNRLEGIDRACAVLRGSEVPEEIMVRENGIQFVVELKNGQKTGFFADQRENRRLFSEYCKDKDVLDAFCYTGAFALYAANAGAKSVLAVDTSAPAIETGRRNSEVNDAHRVEFIQANAIDFLKRDANDGPRFDVAVIDPPKLAPTRNDVDKAIRKYGEVNQLAMRVLRDGGMLMTCSCSHHITDHAFDRMLAEAAVSAGRNVQILNRSGQAPDHPVKAGVEEGSYLKARLCRVTSV